MENNTTIQFRTDTNGNLITVTEQNTKIKYYRVKTITVGRIVISLELVNIKSTFKARTAYFMYNNRIARAKRAVVRSYRLTMYRIHTFFAKRGVEVHLTY